MSNLTQDNSLDPNITYNLTPKQRRFVDAYLGPAQGKALEAARLAGYSGTPNSLSVQAHDNLNNPKIQAAIRARVSFAAMSQEEVLQELGAVARLPLEKVTSDSKLLAGKVRSLELLAKHHGLLKELAKNPQDAARSAYTEIRARFPGLTEGEARQIVADTFAVAESDLVQ